MNYARPLIIAATLLTSTAAFSAMIPEGNYPEQAIASVARQQDNVRPDLVNNGAVRPWDRAGHPAFVPYDAPTPSRASVVADRQEWAVSGLAAKSSAAEPQFATPSYQQKLAHYHQSGMGGSGE